MISGDEIENMGKPLVYLAGSITAATDLQARDWRTHCRDSLAPDIEVLSPTRQKFEVIDETLDLSCEEHLRMMKHGRGIAMRDRFDVARCHLLIVNLKNARSISIGSVGEVFWADAYRKPVIMVREQGNIHTHAMLDALVGWIFEDLDEAIATARTLLAKE
jgi:nucleoside 2-deoxyribosyltransferase